MVLADLGGGDAHEVYPQSSDGALSLAPMCIGANGELRFWDWLQAEEESPTTGWDCAIVEASTDLGAIWELLEPVGGYTHTKAWSSGNPIPNDTPCWSGSHNWREEVFDLASYAAFFDGKLEDYEYPEEAIKTALAELPVVEMGG